MDGHPPASDINYPTYEFVEVVEPFERYAPGGYYPVRIGDEFCSSRYRIVHKLGFGTSSTTWLARDNRENRYVAIKFAISELDAPFESAILKILRDGENCGAKAHIGTSMIPEILDEFKMEGPEIQGKRWKHSCLVTTAARMNLAGARDASSSRLFQLPVARAIAAQLIHAVAFVHSRGIIHGDLHEGNILLRLPDFINSLTPDQLYEKYGQPALETIKRSDGEPLDEWVPSHGVVPIWFGDASDTISLADSYIFLSDFSESFQPAVNARVFSHTPLVLRPPELFLEPTAQVTFSTEIWSLACAVFSIMGQRGLFESWFPSQDTILEEHVDTLGRLPEELWTSWVNRGDFFDDQVQRVDGDPRRVLKDRLEYSVQELREGCGMAQMDGDEKTAFLLLLRSMLSYRPEERISAQQVLESDWMQKWAQPAYGSMEDKINI